MPGFGPKQPSFRAPAQSKACPPDPGAEGESSGTSLSLSFHCGSQCHLGLEGAPGASVALGRSLEDLLVPPSGFFGDFLLCAFISHLGNSGGSPGGPYGSLYLSLALLSLEWSSSEASEVALGQGWGVASPV